MPWCTYTDPEIAHVGLYKHEAEAQGIETDTFTVHFDENDRAVADGEEEGFVRIHLEKGTDKILGTTIVARTAGDMINEITAGYGGWPGTESDWRCYSPPIRPRLKLLPGWPGGLYPHPFDAYSAKAIFWLAGF